MYNLVELFSGIGSQAKALEKIGVDFNVVKTCEWDIQALVAYDTIHNGTVVLPETNDITRTGLIDILSNYNLSHDGKTLMSFKTLSTFSTECLRRIYSAIIRCNNAVDITKLEGKELDMPIDILTYSFPCQDLSNVGAFHGYQKGIEKGSGSRSSLLWEVGRILSEMKRNNHSLPRFLLLENVPTLLSDRHKESFKIWKNQLAKLGYYNHVYVLNAANCGIPQNRPRLVMISVLLPCEHSAKIEMKHCLKDYFKTHNLEDLNYLNSLGFNKVSIENLLRDDYSNPILFEEAKECQPNDTISRRKIWNENPKLKDKDGKLNYDIVRTLTCKQDRHPNSGNLYFDYEGNTKSKFRYLTPRECFMFMGFEESDFEKLKFNNVKVTNKHNLFTRDKMIRMAGNSIPVNLLERVFEQIVEIDNLFLQ